MSNPSTTTAQIEGRRAIVGISDNAGNDLSFSWFTPLGVAITATGTVVPLSGSVAHGGDIKKIKDNKGNSVTIFATNESITIEIVAVPLGASGTNTLAAALTAAQFPAPAGWLTIANAPVIAMGNFADSINADNWSYNADGRVEMASEGEWGIRFTCTRHLYIAKSNGANV